MRAGETVERTGSPALIRVWSLLCSFRFGGGTLDDEVVVDAEGAGGRVGLHACDGGAGLIENDAVEGAVAVLHDDVDGVVAHGRCVGDASGGEGDAGAGSDGAADAALVGVIFAQGGLSVDVVVDGGAD